MSDVYFVRNSYGKSDVRLTKVLRDGARHELLEFSVDIELFGDFADTYLAGDNSKIIATDSMKNTVYVIAAENQFRSAEELALLLAGHFVKTYPQVFAAEITVRQPCWKRIDADGIGHDHAFVAGGSDYLEATALATSSGEAKQLRLTGGIRDLVVAKTTRSAFEKFVTDRYRTLPDAAERIFGTNVSATWRYGIGPHDFPAIAGTARATLLKVFAEHLSRSVQETMYAMGQAVIDAVPAIEQIDLRLPNKHRIPFNLKPFGLENEDEVFVWTDVPYGDIRCTLRRK